MITCDRFNCSNEAEFRVTVRGTTRSFTVYLCHKCLDEFKQFHGSKPLTVIRIKEVKEKVIFT